MQLKCSLLPHIKTAKTDRESAGKIKFLILWIRDTCFRVSLCSNTAVTLIFSDGGFCLRWMLKVYIYVCSCGDGSAHCKVLLCSSNSPLWVNDTDPWLFDFNKEQLFKFNLDYSSFNAFYSVEADALTSCKAANCFDSLFILTSNAIWNPPVIILPTYYLDRAMKYVEHSWKVHACALSGTLVDNCKKY